MVLVPLGYFCSIEHARLHGQVKAKTEKQKKEKARFNERKKQFKDSDIKYQHKITQPVFNKMRVLQELAWFKERGLEPACISCQKTIGNDQWCCGHKKTQGGNSRLRYDVKNTFLQHNNRCNMHKSGDIEGYNNGLLARFGEIEGQALIEYQNNNTGPKKWTCEEVKSIRLDAYAQIRELNILLLGKAA